MAQPHIKTRHLALLMQLDRDRSVLRAAQAIGMSQPAASKLLRELEDSLGVQLFERHARGVEPTAYGDILVRHAQAALLEMQRAADEVAALRSGQGVRVSIGTVMSPGTDLVPLALSLLAQRHPQMAVDVEMDFSRPMVARLLQGRLELVVGRVLDPEHADALHFEPLAEEPHRLVARPGHPLARQPGLAIADLVEFPWVLPQPQSILRERLVAMFLQRGLALPRKIVETSSLPLTVPLLRGTDMLVALPEDVVRPYCEAGMLATMPVDLGVSMPAYGLIVPRDRPLSPGAAQTLAALREAAALLASGHGTTPL